MLYNENVILGLKNHPLKNLNLELLAFGENYGDHVRVTRLLSKLQSLMPTTPLTASWSNQPFSKWFKS